MRVEDDGDFPFSPWYPGAPTLVLPEAARKKGTVIMGSTQITSLNGRQLFRKDGGRIGPWPSERLLGQEAA